MLGPHQVGPDLPASSIMVVEQDGSSPVIYELRTLFVTKGGHHTTYTQVMPGGCKTPPPRSAFIAHPLLIDSLCPVMSASRPRLPRPSGFREAWPSSTALGQLQVPSELFLHD